MVLARLLLPADFGILAMAAAFVGLAGVVGDFGLSMAAVQSQSINQQQRSNLFWTNCLLGVVLFGAAWVTAPWLAAFYGAPELTMVTRVLAISFLANAAGAQFRAEMSSRLRFVPLAAIDIVAALVALAAAIVVAVAGGGFWALLVQHVAVALLTLIGLAAAARWWPALPRATPGMRALYAYGANTLGLQVITYATSNLDDVLVGRFWGAGALGVYSRAYQLFRLPMQQLGAPMTRVALPILSKLQADPRYNAYVERAQLVLAYSFGGVFFVLAALTDPLIDIVLGPGWDAAKPIFAALAVGGVFQAMGFVYYWVFLSKALTGLQLRWSIVGRVAMAAAMAIGVIWGPFGVAVGSAVGQVVVWLLTTVVPMRRTGVDVAVLVRIALRPVVLFTPLTVAALWLSFTVMEGWAAPLQLIALVVLGVLYVCLGALLPAVRQDYRDLLHAVRHVR